MNCTLHLNYDGVSRVQAIIYRQGGGYMLVNQSSRGTAVNGQSVAQAQLQPGDIISFADGAYQFQFISSLSGRRPSGAGGGGGTLPTIDLEETWADQNKRYILIGCAIQFICMFLPFYSVAGFGYSFSSDMPMKGPVIVLCLIMAGLVFIEAYMIHIILGVIQALFLLFLLFAGGGVFGVSAGPGIGAFGAFAGSILMVVGGYRGFMENR
jgi:hypothetical protein